VVQIGSTIFRSECITTRSVVWAAAEIAPIAVPAASATAAAVIFHRLFMPVSLLRGHAPRPPPARRVDRPAGVRPDETRGGKRCQTCFGATA
jgi:hypothetical protein